MDINETKLELSKQATDMAMVAAGRHITGRAIDLEYVKCYRMLCNIHEIDYNESVLYDQTADSRLIESMAGQYYAEYSALR